MPYLIEFDYGVWETRAAAPYIPQILQRSV